MSSLKDCKKEFDEWVKKHGYGDCDYVIREWRKQRVNPERDDKVSATPLEKMRLFERQKGICPVCHCALFLPATNPKNEVDHIDPNRQDINHKTNKQLVHGDPCNRHKSSKSMIQQSKESGKTIQELIQPGFDNSEEGA